MFDLEQQITEWRSEMLAAGITTPIPLDELESHLRDDIEQRLKSGFSDRRAFDAAVQHIGQARALKAEFATAAITASPGILRRIYIFSLSLSDVHETGAPRTIQRLFGWLCVALMGFILWMTGYTVFNMELTSEQRALIFGGVVSVLLVGACWRRAVSLVPIVTNRRLRLVLAVCMFSLLLCCEFFMFLLYDQAIIQTPVLIFWAPLPWIAFGTLGCGFLMNDNDRQRLGLRTTDRK